MPSAVDVNWTRDHQVKISGHKRARKLKLEPRWPGGEHGVTTVLETFGPRLLRSRFSTVIGLSDSVLLRKLVLTGSPAVIISQILGLSTFIYRVTRQWAQCYPGLAIAQWPLNPEPHPAVYGVLRMTDHLEPFGQKWRVR